MEKISSILPSNPRLKSVDTQDAHPVRPGVPAMGRPIGRTTNQDRFTVSQKAKDLAFQETLGARNPSELAHVKIADTMAKKFFETRLQPKAESTRAEEIMEPVSAPVPDENTAIKGGYIDTEG